MYRKKRSGKLLYILLLAILLAVFFVSGYFVVDYLLESREQGAIYDELAAIMENEATAVPTEPEETVPTATEEDAPKIPTILPAYLKLHRENPDMVGWIKIDGTDISYPVMQSPDRKDYYLYRNFYGQQSSHGSIYVREECDIVRPSDNVVIYGHRMKDGSMFENLTKFERQSFWEEYPSIRFDTVYEEHTYEVFAVFRTTAILGKGFEYHNFLEAATEADFDAYVDTCKSLALYDTGITPEYGDKLITLSTCEYSQPNGRLVVVAVRRS